MVGHDVVSALICDIDWQMISSTSSRHGLSLEDNVKCSCRLRSACEMCR